MVITPAPPVTEKDTPDPVVDQAPPVSADPHPEPTERPNASTASGSAEAGDTDTVRDASSDCASLLSVTTRVIVLSPGVVYSCVVVGPVVSSAGLPSPQSQVYVASVAEPNASDADPSTETDMPVAVAVKDALGGCSTATWWVTLAVAFALSVTVSLTVKGPAVVYVWLVVWPVPVAPSPKSHAYPVIVRPVLAADALASKSTVMSFVVLVNEAVGAVPLPAA